jgi:hypothetical protein
MKAFQLIRTQVEQKNVKSKPGDLDSWDQLRSRSRLSFVLRPELFIVSRLSIMSRPDFFSWLKFLKSRRFSRDFVASRFLLRLLRFVETHQDLSKFVETHPDLSRNLDIIETFWVWKWWKVLTNWEISTRKCKKSTHFSIKIKTSCRETPKFSDLDEFLDLDRDFLVWTLMTRCFFENVEIFSTVETNSLTMSRSRLSIETRSREIETPRLSKESKLGYMEG